MGFGASRNVEATSMDEADPIIAWVDNNGVANAVDYHLQSRTQVKGSVHYVVYIVWLHFSSTD